MTLSPFKRVLAAPAHRRGKWLILVLWLVVIALAAPFGSKIWGIANNETVAWLPKDAESTRVVALQNTTFGSETLSALVVYHRDAGITAADHARATADYQKLMDRFVAPGAGTIPANGPSPVVASRDGKGLLYVIPLKTKGVKDPQLAVKDMRAMVGEGGNGFDIKLTGGAGYLYDLVNSFSGLNTRLLLATVSIVALLLLLIYRSPVLWLVPLIVVLLASQVAAGVAYAMLKATSLTANSESIFILTVLVFGAGTDYALLLMARYREELRRHEDTHVAMRAALVAAGPAIVASASTVVLGMIVLLASAMNSNRSLGPIVAVGIITALIAMLTLLPAVLLALGRWIFWPFIPHFGDPQHEASGIWSAVGRRIAPRPRTVWITTVAFLVICALGMLTTTLGLSQADGFRTTPDAIKGQRLLAESFSAGAGEPATIIARAGSANAVIAAAKSTPGVTFVQPGQTVDGLTQISVTLGAAPGSGQELSTIQALRDNVHKVSGADALVGGSGAQSLDLKQATNRDEAVLMPLTLLVVGVVLAILLRSLLAPVLLIGTVVLSFAASLGVSSVVFQHLLGFKGLDRGVPLTAFVFLVALGVDYNIFLMSRVHEESHRIGTRPATQLGLAVTGGVITSAGLVLAATFSVLTILPFVSMAEIGLLVAIGVLLDTFIVRSVLVPALCLDLGDRIWWPGALARRAVASSRAAKETTRATAD